MIPVLFKSDATDFTTFGMGVLSDCISCEVTEERNGIFELSMKYPVTGRNYAEIKTERIIKAKPNDAANDQAFRIYRITTPLDGVVSVYAQHISYDLSNIATEMFSSEKISPQLAMERVFQNTVTDHNFICQTEYTEPKAFSVTRPQSVRACLGGTEGSFLDIWGGEYEWDNFKVIQHIHRGTDSGVTIEYGKNLLSMEHDDDESDVYTDLLPYAVQTDESGDETVITLPEVLIPIIDSVLTRRKTLIKDFSDFFEYGTEITADALRGRANDYLSANPMGVSLPSLTVSFEPLWKMPEYAAVLERVSLCDTVTIRHSVLGITAKTKVIQTVYDVLSEKYVSITLGAAKANLADSVSQTERTINRVTSKVDRMPSVLNAAVTNATNLITGQNGGYVVINSSDTGQPYEILILDEPSIENAVNVWRWNSGGLGFSHNGYNGPYETAITSDGQIVADFITTGTLAANLIKAGVLSSQDGSSYWDLESGEVHLKAYATNTDVKEVSDRVGEIEEKKMLRLVISSTNGNIFKNGIVSTTLYATVFSWDENITDTLDDNQFIWTRVSDDTESDREWNSAHFGGSKSINITSDDVKVRATFFCDLIDTTTRQSLLG